MRIARLSGTPDPGTMGDEAETLLDRIDTELMKRGTLAAETVNWALVRETAVQVLKHCLHVQALRALILGLCQQGRDEGLPQAVALAAQMLGPAWPVLHPQGARSERRRKQAAQDALSALMAALQAADLAARGLEQGLIAEVDAFVVLAGQAGLEIADFTRKAAALRPLGRTVPTRVQEACSDPGSSAVRELDAKSRAELRRDIRALAERVSRHEPGAEVAYLMRRYAAWLEFRSLPAVDDGGKVEQQPMPANICDEFRQAAENPSVRSLLRLEDRLLNSPDWFEGQQMAAQMAGRLGLARVEEAIRQEVARRLEALPGLAALRYANGVPYLPADILDWAGRITHCGTPKGAAAPAIEVAPSGLEQRISEAEAQVLAGASLRSRAVAKLVLARELASSGLTRHAQLLLRELSETLSDPVLSRWDRELADEVTAQIAQLGG